MSLFLLYVIILFAYIAITQNYKSIPISGLQNEQ